MLDHALKEDFRRSDFIHGMTLKENKVLEEKLKLEQLRTKKLLKNLEETKIMTKEKMMEKETVIRKLRQEIKHCFKDIPLTIEGLRKERSSKQNDKSMFLEKLLHILEGKEHQLRGDVKAKVEASKLFLKKDVEVHNHLDDEKNNLRSKFFSALGETLNEKEKNERQILIRKIDILEKDNLFLKEIIEESKNSKVSKEVILEKKQLKNKILNLKKQLKSKSKNERVLKDKVQSMIIERKMLVKQVEKMVI